MNDELAFAERPAKRIRLSSDQPEHHSATDQGEYIAIARHSCHLIFADTNVEKSLHKEDRLKDVEILNAVHHNHLLDVRLRLPWLKQDVEAQVCEISATDADKFLTCLRLPCTIKRGKTSTDQPLAKYQAILTEQDYLPTLNVTILWHDSIYPREKIDETLRGVLSKYLLGSVSAGYTDAAPWEVKEFYDNVHVPPITDRESKHLRLDFAQCQLYPFQDRATEWMLSREGVNASDSRQLRTSPEHNRGLPLDFRETRDAVGSICYVSNALGAVTSSRKKFESKYRDVKGGILAEAMGLGKTVEMIALISLHTRSRTPLKILNPAGLQTTNATLVITPPTILEQWKQEITQHAPNLRVMHYTGLKAKSKRKDHIAAELAAQDVVLTTYSVISSEIYYVQERPDRSLRSRPRREPPKSPLTQILWWRCLLDEAQMVETGVSNTAIVARLIPRVNAWAVTGTPLKQSHRDLHGLLMFLKYEPWCQSNRTWDSLVYHHRDLFRKMISQIALRHSKELVRDELRIPPQSRQVVTLPFTAIEVSHYNQLHQHMQQDCGLDSSGAPLEEEWDPDSSVTIEKMRSWLQRLRQTCLHPEVGGRNRKALGRKGGPLRTVVQVLDVMIEQTDSNIHTEQRNVLMHKLDQARIFEHARDIEAAEPRLHEADAEATRFVEECRATLAAELAKVLPDGEEGSSDMSAHGTEEDDIESSLATARQRLRLALEVQHICAFFIGNIHYQRRERYEWALRSHFSEHQQDKTNETNTDDAAAKHADTAFVDRLYTAALDTHGDDVKTYLQTKVAELVQIEIQAYERAKTIRSELLQEVQKKAQTRIKAIRFKKEGNTFATLPELVYSEDDFGGIESRKILEKLYHYCNAINTQAEQFKDTRFKMTEMLCRALVDEDEGIELTGDEYEDSTKHQDEMYVMMEMLRALFADRSDALSGQENLLLKQETKGFLRQAKEGEGPAPELLIRLFSEREKHRIDTSQQGSLRGIITEIRSLASQLEWQASGSTRARAELAIVSRLLQHVQQTQAAQTKALNALEQEVNQFRDAMNARLDFYRALQKVSDMVVPIGTEETVGLPANGAHVRRLHDAQQTAAKKLSIAASKRRYLLHLKTESESEGTAKICTICQFEFEIGTLTVCGHQFCKECIQMWWSEHRRCPVCKRHLQLSDFYDVTYKKPAVTINDANEVSAEANKNLSIDSTQSNVIYNNISPNTLQNIKAIDLRGASYGSKVDTIVRHILYLRQSDPGSKAVVFSQYRDFLDVLGRSLNQNRICHSKFDDKDGIVDFKSNPANECFLLHAKAHATGLNLVCASHVILCEPLINTAIELQAVARVHRIGQQRATTVWMYLIQGTVEEAIYDISVQRRLAHMNSKSAEASRHASRAGTPHRSVRGEVAVEAADAKELQAAGLSKMFAKGKTGGELVDKEDLWRCLFGNRPATRNVGSVAADKEAIEAGSEIGRFLRAEAAEVRAECI